jgi:hypothetical protein
MKELLGSTHKERRQIFEEAASRSQNIKNPVIIEKDFWVCWTLDQIFSSPTLSPHIIFKGGTSLSKCYNMIERFSEDIDLTLSKEYIGITEANDPANVATHKQRDKRLNELSNKVKNKIVNDIKPFLTEEFRNNISTYFQDSEWKLELDEVDDQSLIFHYPSTFEKKSGEYIQSAIKLEFGARGCISPCELKIVSPYYQQLLPELFSESSEIKVQALLAKRTYWEKITLLHAEYHRDPKKPLPRRLFRHYYDIAMLDQKNLTDIALQDLPLLNDVVRNKMTYFPAKWASYESATIGTLRIYPNESFIDHLKQDYGKMVEMFFGEAPDFDKTLDDIKRIEKFINKA